VISEAGEVHRRPHQVAGELVKTLGVGGIDGGSVVNAEARVPPRQEKVDALGSDEPSVSKKSEDFVAEEALGNMGVEVRDGKPRAVIEENPL
jgi:hypothetical protein